MKDKPDTVERTITMLKLTGLFLAAAATALLATAAAAQPSNYSGYVLRGNLPGEWAHRDNHLWRFAPGGALRGVYTTIAPNTRGGAFVTQHDRGRWRVNAGQLCVTFGRWFRGREQCYRVEHLNGNWHRFVSKDGSYSFRGVLARS